MKISGQSHSARNFLPHRIFRTPQNRDHAVPRLDSTDFSQPCVCVLEGWLLADSAPLFMGLGNSVGLVLIYLLVVSQFKSYVVALIIMAPIPLTARRDARPCPDWRSIHGHFDDRNDRAGWHHRAQLDPADRFHQSRNRPRPTPAHRHHRCRRRARQTHRADWRGGHGRRFLHHR